MSAPDVHILLERIHQLEKKFSWQMGAVATVAFLSPLIYKVLGLQGVLH